MQEMPGNKTQRELKETEVNKRNINNEKNKTVTVGAPRQIVQKQKTRPKKKGQTNKKKSQKITTEHLRPRTKSPRIKEPLTQFVLPAAEKKKRKHRTKQKSKPINKTIEPKKRPK